MAIHVIRIRQNKMVEGSTQTTTSTTSLVFSSGEIITFWKVVESSKLV